VQQPDVGTPSAQRHRQRLDHELGGIADPSLIRHRRDELPIEQIGRNRVVVVAHRRACDALTDSTDQAVRLHQPHDARAAHRVAVLDQVFPDARAAVAVATGGEERADLDAQLPVALRSHGGPAARPGVEATARHMQTSTQDRHRVPGLLRGDEGESHRWCFAKKAAAFLGSRALPGESDSPCATAPAPPVRLTSARCGPSSDRRARGCLSGPGPTRSALHATISSYSCAASQSPWLIVGSMLQRRATCLRTQPSPCLLSAQLTPGSDHEPSRPDPQNSQPGPSNGATCGSPP